jgi:hypothetical protein
MYQFEERGIFEWIFYKIIIDCFKRWKWKYEGNVLV